MSNRDDLLNLLEGRGQPERIPFVFMGFNDEKAMHKLAPADCWDENTYCNPSDDPPRDRFSSEPRTRESRQRAVRMSEYLDMATVGVGKGGVFPFGHGGPGEIQPLVVERTREYKILQYEGGHRRRFNYDPHSIRFYDFPLKTAADLETLQLPDMKDPARFSDIPGDARFIREAGYMSTGCIQGFFSGIHNSFMAFEDTLVNLLLEPEFMRQVTAILAEMSLDAVDMLLERGVEIINVCDDLGNADGLLISPQVFREFFLPWYEELTRRVHERGAYLHLHSHGNIAPVLPDLVAIGVDIINPFDWDENPDLPALVKQYGRDIIFCGGVIGSLYEHSTDEIRHIVERACGLAEIAERGYILITGGALDTLSHEQWDAWLEIFSRAREGRKN